MNNAQSCVTTLLDSLPPTWRPAVEALAEQILFAQTPLRLITLGAFSVGKSSLLNMLLQESVLQSALEESTALPTFIEYSVQREMALVNHDGSQTPLDETQFAHVTTHAPEGAACAVLNLPQAWLQGVSVIDLPGLGSLSNTHREYTLAQINLADAVLYLLNPTGPSTSDIETLRLIKQAGKRVKVVVARWDEIEKAVACGEKQPSLENWAKQIEQATGLKARLTPCHREGLGREDIQEFTQRACSDLEHIRLQRFYAELKPLLENALGQNADQQQSCAALNEEAAREWHERLVERKNQLAQCKTKVYAEQQQDLQRITDAAAQGLNQVQQALDERLNTISTELATEKTWSEFGQRGTDAVREATLRVAQLYSQLSSQYGQLNLPDAQIAEFNLRLPVPETVSEDDFLDIGRLTQLQEAFAAKEDEISALETHLATTAQQATDASSEEYEEALQALMKEKNRISAHMPTTVAQTVQGNGGLVGRLLGETLDVGMMFITPVAAGTKIASLLGKGSMIANGVQKTVSTLQSAQQIANVAKAHPALDKLAGLEKLSLGYWGEQLGHKLGGGSRVIHTVDHEALQARDAALADIDQQINQVRRALDRNEDIANERQLSGWALEQSKKEQQRLTQEIERLRHTAEQRRRDTEQQLIENQQRQIGYNAARAKTMWLRAFEQNTSGMSNLLRTRVKAYWEERVDGLLNERLHDIGALEAQSHESTEVRQATLQQLRIEADALQGALQQLSA